MSPWISIKESRDSPALSLFPFINCFLKNPSCHKEQFVSFVIHCIPFILIHLCPSFFPFFPLLCQQKSFSFQIKKKEGKGGRWKEMENKKDEGFLEGQVLRLSFVSPFVFIFILAFVCPFVSIPFSCLSVSPVPDVEAGKRTCLSADRERGEEDGRKWKNEPYSLFFFRRNKNEPYSEEKE